MSEYQSVQCYVYKGDRKEDHFLFLAQPLDEILTLQEQGGEVFLPQALLLLLGELKLIVEFELTPDRKLPQADAQQILAGLESQGFYLQMPRTTVSELEDIYFN